MTRAVKHVNLHRIGSTELRVISDVDAGVLPIIQEEERVIRGYIQQERWTQRMVSLFILKDLQPLVSQVQGGGALPPGDTAALDDRTVINVYDLADPTVCHIFVNQQAMVKAGYWDDLVATRALLAHEHAHPLAENATTRASRQLRLVRDPASDPLTGTTVGSPTSDGPERVERLLTDLADQICLKAPRELFTNELAITSGFADAMLHLNHQNVVNAAQSLTGRDSLRWWLEQEVAQGKRTTAEVDHLLLVGDLTRYLNLAIETAPFYRAGREADARTLERILEDNLFPHLAAEVRPTYTAVRDRYLALRGDLSTPALRAWSQDLLDILARAQRDCRFLIVDF